MTPPRLPQEGVLWSGGWVGRLLLRCGRGAVCGGGVCGRGAVGGAHCVSEGVPNGYIGYRQHEERSYDEGECFVQHIHIPPAHGVA